MADPRGIEVRTGGGHHVVLTPAELERQRRERLHTRERELEDGLPLPADVERDLDAGLDPSDLEIVGVGCGPHGCRRRYREAARDSARVAR